jgi:glucose-6-phosphate-specific signal transduction histidine kinase
METNAINKQYKFSLQLIAIALILGQLLFLFVTTLVHKHQIIFYIHDAFSTFGFVLLFLSIIISFAYGYLTRKNKKKLQAETNFERKKLVLQSTILIQYALLEGISLFAIVCFLLSSNVYYLIFSCISIVVQVYIFPSLARINSNLQLNKYEDLHS